MKRALLGVTLALTVGGCAKSAEGVAAAPAIAAPGLSIDEYERLLAQNEVALRQQGVRLPPSGTATAVAQADVRPVESADGDDYADATSEEDDGTVLGGAAAGPNATGAESTAQAASEPAPFPEAEKELQRRGVSANRGPRREKRDAVDPEVERCEMICELAAATCDLEAKICELAAQHPQDPRYQNACARASRDCEIAQEACLECTG